MAGFRSLVTTKEDGHEARAKGAETIKEMWPTLYEVLVGTEKTATDMEVPPATVAVFLEGTKAKFVINVKGGEHTFFGVVADLAKPFDSIECALMMGEVSRKRDSGRKYSSEDLEKMGTL